MQDTLIVYHPLTTLSLPIPDGGTHEASLPEIAQIDASFLQQWLFDKARKTQIAYVADIHKLYTCVGKPLRQITLQDVQTFIMSLAGLKVSTRARATATVKSVLSFGIRTGYLQFNVGSVVKLPTKENTLAERIMSERQVYKVLDGGVTARNHAMLTLLYYGGLRASEVCNLQWRHLQERNEAGQIAVFGKGNKTRFILLDAETWQEVMALKRAHDGPQDYVFRSRQERSRTNEHGDHGRLDESMVYRIVREAAALAGVQGNVSPHWLRHAHASHALDRGSTIAEVQSTLGHGSIETTAQYTHIRPGTSTARVLRGTSKG